MTADHRPPTTDRRLSVTGAIAARNTQPPTRNTHVVIVGGGIAGLTVAYELREAARNGGLPISYTLLESDQALGGKIVTERVDGFVIEGGPDSFLSQKPWAEDLCRRLGLGDGLIGTNDAQRAVFVLNRGRLVRLPEGLNLIVPIRLIPFLRSPLISWPGKLRMCLELFIPRRRSGRDESVAVFVRRRLGQEAVEKLAEPLLSGIYAAEPEQQSILATFPRFRDLELKHGSLIRGMVAQRRATARTPNHRPRSAFLSLRGGIQQLVEALQRALVDGQIVTGARVVGLERHNGAGYRVRIDTGESFDADAVVLATPAYVSASFVSGFAPELAGALNGIRYVSTATVSLGFRRADVAHHPLNGFGFVIPRRERRRIFGCTWTSTKLSHRAGPQDVLVRCFVGGAGREELVSLSDEDLLALVQEELSAIMGLDAKPVITRIFRWHKANPQYDVGHAERVRDMYALCAAQPGLFLAGGAYEGVGLPDTIRQGQGTARHVLAYLTQLSDVLSVAGA